MPMTVWILRIYDVMYSSQHVCDVETVLFPPLSLRKLRHRRVRVWRSPKGHKWWGWRSISAIHGGHTPPLSICAKSMRTNHHKDWSQLLLCHSEPEGAGIRGGSSRSYGVRGRGRFLLASHTNWGNNTSTLVPGKAHVMFTHCLLFCF